MDKEAEFVKKLISTFEIHFNVATEVWSKCKTKRIDLVLTHKIHKQISFGIECKKPDKKRGEKIGHYLKQAIHYTKLEWCTGSEYKKIPVLLCPPLSYKYFVLNETEQLINNQVWVKDRHQPDNDHHSFNGFLGAFSVGEIRKNKYGYYFVMSNKTLFKTSIDYITKKTIESVHFDNYNYVIKKINL
jgi:hypothetical protein